MTNFDSMLKSRDVTLPTIVCIVKAMIFPIVMYGCESWTIKKADCLYPFRQTSPEWIVSSRQNSPEWNVEG